jgi:hypothetical protein
VDGLQHALRDGRAPEEALGRGGAAALRGGYLLLVRENLAIAPDLVLLNIFMSSHAWDLCRGPSEHLPSFERALAEIQDAAGAVPLVAMLIPDEFQGEDDLFAAIVARRGPGLDRDRPQRDAAAILAKLGIPALDLLPVLRAVRPLADGRRHLYHARDTHWNARGNRIAGEALARFLRAMTRGGEAGR